MDAAKAASKGYARLSEFLSEAENAWRRHSKKARTFTQQIDFFGNLSGQFPLAPLRIVYTKTGTNLAAAVLRHPDAIVENGLYWAATKSESEAHYLAAILNSETIRSRAEKWQATGQWGARHFDRVIFNLPIPRFDEGRPLHVELASTAARAEKVAAALPLKEGQHFTRARKQIRTALIANGVAGSIEALTVRLLEGAV